MFLHGVSGSVFACSACACMLFSVKFHVGMRDVRMLKALRENEFRKKKKGSVAQRLLQLCCASGYRQV
jgi:hypothetical protein